METNWGQRWKNSRKEKIRQISSEDNAHNQAEKKPPKTDFPAIFFILIHRNFSFNLQKLISSYEAIYLYPAQCINKFDFYYFHL